MRISGEVRLSSYSIWQTTHMKIRIWRPSFPERVEQMSELMRSHVARGRSTAGPKLENDKKVKIVNIRDRRLPRFVAADSGNESGQAKD